MDTGLYGDLELTSLNAAARQALEAMMKGYEYQSDFAKKYVASGRPHASGPRFSQEGRVLLSLDPRRDLW